MTTLGSIESAESPHDRNDSTRPALRATAEFLGGLLVKEVDGTQLEQLRAPALERALTEIGIELPTRANQEAWIEERGAEYHDVFLRPQTGPLVQSLWTQGRYEGDATVRIRQLAAAAAVEYQKSAARGAAVDHLGSLLLLWSKTDGDAQDVADEIVRAHLDWAIPGLRRIESLAGFYGAVASASLTLIEELVAT